MPRQCSELGTQSLRLCCQRYSSGHCLETETTGVEHAEGGTLHYESYSIVICQKQAEVVSSDSQFPRSLILVLKFLRNPGGKLYY